MSIIPREMTTNYDIMRKYADDAAKRLGMFCDEAIYFLFMGWKRSRIGVIDLHKYRGIGRPRGSDYVPREQYEIKP